MCANSNEYYWNIIDKFYWNSHMNNILHIEMFYNNLHMYVYVYTYMHKYDKIRENTWIYVYVSLIVLVVEVFFSLSCDANW